MTKKLRSTARPQTVSSQLVLYALPILRATSRTIPQIAAAAGVGLGQGASKGLGLADNGATKPVTKRQATDGSSQMDIPGIVGNLTMGLSQSFLESANLSSLVPSGAAGLNLNASTLVSLASGAGKGIGAGVAAGLGGNVSDISTNSTALSER